MALFQVDPWIVEATVADTLFSEFRLARDFRYGKAPRCMKF